MKKIISILLVFAMMFAITGCGKKNTTDTNDQKSNTDVATNDTTKDNTKATVTPPAVEVYNLVMEIVNFGYDDKDIKLVEDELNKITEAKIGVHVTFLTVPIANMATKLELMVAGGEKIDLVQTGLLTTPNRLAASGLLTPMTQYLTDNLKQLAGDLLKASTINGEVYAYPANLYPGNATSLLYDADLAKQYNIQMPDKISSMDDLEKIFAQVKKSGMTQYPYSAGDGVNTEYVMGADYESLGDATFNSFGVVMGNDTNNKVVDWYESDVYKKQCELKKAWFDKGYLLPDSISNGYTVIDSMKQGTIFSLITPIGTGSSEAYWSAQTGKNLKSVPITDVVITASGTVNLSYGISSNSENPKKVCEFLDLLYTDKDVANLLNYGIKGTHYVTQDNSNIIKYPEGINPTNAGYGSFIGPIGNGAKMYFREPFTDEFVNNISKYGLEKAKVSKYMGYSFDNKEVQSEIAAVNAVIAQYGPSLACGIVDVEPTLKDFTKALKDAGIDKIVAANQSQLDQWLAKQK